MLRRADRGMVREEHYHASEERPAPGTAAKKAIEETESREGKGFADDGDGGGARSLSDGEVHVYRISPDARFTYVPPTESKYNRDSWKYEVREVKRGKVSEGMCMIWVSKSLRISLRGALEGAKSARDLKIRYTPEAGAKDPAKWWSVEVI